MILFAIGLVLMVYPALLCMWFSWSLAGVALLTVYSGIEGLSLPWKMFAVWPTQLFLYKKIEFVICFIAFGGL